MMLSPPRRPEIDHRTTKLIVGVVALLLAAVTSALTGNTITSISAAYWEGGVSATIFVGSLFAIAAFLLAYNGYSRPQMIWSKVAAIAGLCISLFPCNCDERHPEVVPHLHYIAAAVMFGILAFFCYIFYERALAKGGRQAKSRAVIYAVCGFAILIAISALAFDSLTHIISAKIPRFTFWGEETALVSFGISWLTASHSLPLVTTRAESYWTHGGSGSTAD